MISTTASETIVNKDLSIADLKPHPKNYKQHPLVQLLRLQESLKKYGQPRSIVVQDNADGTYTIVAGHGVVEAAKKIKWTAIRADVVPSSWDAAKIRGYLVADNNLNRGSIDNQEILASLIREQVDLGISVNTMGFTQEEANDLFLRVTNSHEADFLHGVINPPPAPRPSFPSSEASDQYDQEEDDEPEYSPASPREEWVAVTYTLSKDQRQIILDAIAKAKRQCMLDVSSEALVHICQAYLAEVP